MSKDSKQIRRLTVKGRTWVITEVEKQGLTQKVKINDEELSVRILREPTDDQPDLVANINGKVLIARREEERDGSDYFIRLNGRVLRVSLEGKEQSSQNAGAAETILGPIVITAPMSGRRWCG